MLLFLSHLGLAAFQLLVKNLKLTGNHEKNCQILHTNCIIIKQIRKRGVLHGTMEYLRPVQEYD
jgi:hypothetical protein